MAHDEVIDVLALAEIEEADAHKGVIDADPLAYRWALPIA